MELEIIYTFENKEQEIAQMNLQEDTLNNLNDFFRLATESLPDDEKAYLVKMSCCIYEVGNITPPNWYEQSNGKFWDDDIRDLNKMVWNIETKATPIN